MHLTLSFPVPFLLHFIRSHERTSRMFGVHDDWLQSNAMHYNIMHCAFRSLSQGRRTPSFIRARHKCRYRTIGHCLQLVYKRCKYSLKVVYCITWNIYLRNTVAQVLLILVFSISRSANVWKYPALVTTKIHTQAMRHLVRVC